MPRIEYADRGGDVRYCQSSRLAVTALPAVLVFAQVRTKDDRKDSEQRQSELWLAIKKNLTGEKGAEWF
jgi:hypothetical protein